MGFIASIINMPSATASIAFVRIWICSSDLFCLFTPCFNCSSLVLKSSVCCLTFLVKLSLDSSETGNKSSLRLRCVPEEFNVLLFLSRIESIGYFLLQIDMISKALTHRRCPQKRHLRQEDRSRGFPSNVNLIVLLCQITVKVFKEWVYNFLGR